MKKKSRKMARTGLALLLAAIMLFEAGDCASIAAAETKAAEEPAGQAYEDTGGVLAASEEPDPASDGERDPEEVLPAEQETGETPAPEETTEPEEITDTEEITDDELSVIGTGEDIAIDETTFPDANLREAAAEFADTDGDLLLSPSETEAVVSLDLSHRDIFSLQGLEVFENLEELDCSWNHLSREEIEPWKKLKKLQYYDNTYLAETREEEIEDWEELPEEEGAVSEPAGIVEMPEPADSDESAASDEPASSEETARPEETAGSGETEETEETEEKPWRFTCISVYSAEDFRDVPIDAATFPDRNFREFLRERYDADEDGILSVGEQRLVTSLYVRGEEIRDLTGVEIFHNLLLLDCSENLLTTLNMHALFQLRGLFCTVNAITFLDLSDNLNLKKLECDEGVEVYGWVPPRMTKADGADAEDAATVNLGTPKLKKLTNSKSEVMTVTYSKVAGADGYSLQLAEDKKFTGDVKSASSTKTSGSFKKLDQGTTYYVRVRAFKNSGDKNKVYGKYSDVKSLKITKGRVWTGVSASAMTLKSVALANRDTVRVKGSASKYVKSVDDYYYIFNLTPSESELPSDREPIAKLAKTKSLSIDVPLKYDTVNNRLQYKFTVGVKTNKSGTYKLISAAKFISNPEKRATATGAFPKSSTKKGLQVNELYISDAAKLGVKHTVYNMCLDDLFAVSSEQNTSRGISYKYAGKTYWFNKGIVQSYDRTLNSYKSNHMIVSAVILLRYRSDLTHLMVDGSQRSGFYALKTSSVKARRPLEAAFTFLANRYATDGRISNWIIGNEVNNYTTYHYTGSTKLAYNAKVYTNSFRLAYIAIRSVYSKARVYISLDHLWNVITSTGHGSKQFLDKFADYWNSYGTCYIAYHAYPWPMTAPEFWTNTSGITNDSGSSCINMKNLGVLTSYVKKKFGSKTRVILSEQGFTSKKNGVTVEKNQAAAVAYAYYIAEFNDMVDAFILHRHIDHQEEVNQGLALGLWTNKPGTTETPGSQKYAYKVFRYMDTSKYYSNTKFAFPIIGKASWKIAVPGFKASRFS